MVGLAAPPRGPDPRTARRARVAWLLRGLVGVGLGAAALSALLMAGLLVWSQTDHARRWVGREVSAAVSEALGQPVSLGVYVELWPLALVAERVTLPSSDGGPPAVEGATLRVEPALLALLSGRLAVDSVALSDAKVRLVWRDGRLANLSLRGEDPSGNGDEQLVRWLSELPFERVVLRDLGGDVEVDGRAFRAEGLGLSVERVSARKLRVDLEVGRSVSRGAPGPVVAMATAPGDLLCGLRAELAVELGEGLAIERIQVASLAAKGSAAFDGALDPDEERCAEQRDEGDRVELDLAGVELELSGATPVVTGAARVLLPLPLLNRPGLVAAPALRGEARFDGEFRWAGARESAVLRGRVSGRELGLFDGREYRLGRTLDAEVAVEDGVVSLARAEVTLADARVVVTGLTVDLAAARLDARHVELDGMTFQGLMRDLGVTADTVVAWDVAHVEVEGFGGTLSPLALAGDVTVETGEFALYDRSFRAPDRQRMLGFQTAKLGFELGVVDRALEFRRVTGRFATSTVAAELVSIGFDDRVDIRVGAGTSIELAETGAVGPLPMTGRLTPEVTLSGQLSDPLLSAKVALEDYTVGGYPVADRLTGELALRGLLLTLENIHAEKGRSAYAVPRATLDFAEPGGVAIDAAVATRTLDLRDFLAMWHAEDAPAFAGLEARLAFDGALRFRLGGREDRCGEGALRVEGALAADEVALFGERFASASASIELLWDDPVAGHHGFRLATRGVALSTGHGVLLGTVGVAPGGHVDGAFVVSGVPLCELSSLGPLGASVDGALDGELRLGGSLDAPFAAAELRTTPVRVDGAPFGASRLRVRLEPATGEPVGGARAAAPAPGTACVSAIPQGNAAGAVTPREAGLIRLDGALLGDSVVLREVSVTRGRHPVLSGNIALEGVELGLLARAAPALQGADAGRLTLRAAIERLPLDAPQEGLARAETLRLELERGTGRVLLEAGPREAALLGGGALLVPELRAALTLPSGAELAAKATLRVDLRAETPVVSARVTVPDQELATLLAGLPRVERAGGKLRGELAVKGPLLAPRVTGELSVAGGLLALRGLPPVTGVDLAVRVAGDDLTLTRGTGVAGGGSLALSGTAHLDAGASLGELHLALAARGVRAEPSEGLRLLVDADLTLDGLRAGEDASALPLLSGSVELRELAYTRPMRLSGSLPSLGAAGPTAEAYDPADERLRLDVLVRASRPLHVANGLIEADLAVEGAGLALLGTDARPGARGELRVVPGGRMRLRRSVFEIREGGIRFDDATRIAPRVDVTAVTEYRRNQTAWSEPGSEPAAGSSSGAALGANTWAITLRAEGDADALTVGLTSDPALAADDLLLLLAVGLTRAELEQAQSASLTGSMALEALGALTGANEAVLDTLPVIDDFRFGSAYSAATGRTEPTVSIGKRITERLRASVTSGLTGESREVQSNLEWRLGDDLSLQGSYDNTTDLSGSATGNLGADVRWRLEFE